VLVEQARILDLPDLKFGGRVGGDVIREGASIRTKDFDLAHVTHVENADAGADGAVLFQDAGLLEGHVPAAEIDHLGAHPAVYGVERGGFDHRLNGEAANGGIFVGIHFENL
jgi:hypothetical protein